MQAQAITITAKEQAELLTTEAPDAPAEGRLLGRTLCTLMSPGTELAYNYTGEKFPNQPGYAAVFEVQQVGGGVSGFAVGDRVFAMGPHASVQHVAADQALPVPAGLDPATAVLARLMGVSMTTLITTAARPGDRVAVTGAGPVGFLAAQLFRLAGYTVEVAEPEERRRAPLAALGFTTHAQLPIAEMKGKLALVVECSGHEQAVLDGCKVVRRGGEVVMVGVPWRARTTLTAHEILHKVFHNYVVLRSGWEWELPMQSAHPTPHSIFGNFRQALDWLAAGRIQAAGQIQLVRPADAQQAYQDNLRRRNTQLFTVFDWRA